MESLGEGDLTSVDRGQGVFCGQCKERRETGREIRSIHHMDIQIEVTSTLQHQTIFLLLDIFPFQG